MFDVKQDHDSDCLCSLNGQAEVCADRVDAPDIKKRGGGAEGGENAGGIGRFDDAVIN